VGRGQAQLLSLGSRFLCSSRRYAAPGRGAGGRWKAGRVGVLRLVIDRLRNACRRWEKNGRRRWTSGGPRRAGLSPAICRGSDSAVVRSYGVDRGLRSSPLHPVEGLKGTARGTPEVGRRAKRGRGLEVLFFFERFLAGGPRRDFERHGVGRGLGLRGGMAAGRRESRSWCWVGPSCRPLPLSTGPWAAACRAVDLPPFAWPDQRESGSLKPGTRSVAGAEGIQGGCCCSRLWCEEPVADLMAVSECRSQEPKN